MFLVKRPIAPTAALAPSPISPKRPVTSSSEKFNDSATPFIPSFTLS